MSYNTELQSNNADLQEILGTVNALPNAEDLVSPTATVTQTETGAVITITDKNGTTTATVTNGKDGAKGEKGDKGDTGETGPQGRAGETGAAGYTPIRGVDYYTDADKSEFSEYIASELAKRGQLAPEFAESMEWLEANGEQDKMYVLNDKTDPNYGMIYAWMLTEVETEGGGYTNRLPTATMGTDQATGWVEGKGYTTQARLSGSGGNVVTNYTNVAGVGVSGYITGLKIGDVIRIKGFYPPTGVSTYVVSYKGTTKVNNQTFNPVNDVESGDLTWQWTDGHSWCTIDKLAPIEEVTVTIELTSANFGSDFDAIRFSGIISENTVVTVNEEIKEKSTVTTTGYAWASTGHAFVPADYEDRIIDLEALTREHTADIEDLKRGAEDAADITEWDAPIYDADIPVFQLSEEKAAMTNAAQTPADIYARYDALMARHPQYITKTDLGLCSDGVDHVYRYDFREPDPRHTSGMRWSETKAKAIIVSGIHYEWAGIYGLYYALEEIAENPDLYSFRRNSHLIVVPCMNPYATISGNYSDSIGVRNANGVEIHRNFEVGWVLTEEGTTHYGGAEPLSEVETQYVDNIMRENTDAALFLTCHSFGDEGFDFIWPSVATPYMCNMGYRLIDKMSDVWLDKYSEELVGLDDYRTSDIPSWDNRLGFAHISQTPGTETRQGTKYGIQSANVEINGRFWVHGTPADPEPPMSSFTMSRGAEVYVNFLLTVFGIFGEGATGGTGPQGPAGADGKDGSDASVTAQSIVEALGYVPANVENVDPLKGKKIVYDGTSLTESRTGASANNGGAFPKIIADLTGGTYANHAVGGAYLRSTDVAGKHSVVDNVVNLPTDGDLYCFEGGVNDYWGGATLGEYSESDYSGTVDATTICGALETLFRYALSHFVGKPIAFIIPHKINKIGTTANSAGNTFAAYREKMIGICEKYSIPYYDAYTESGLNGWNSVQKATFLNASADGTADGVHPNEEGYKRYYVPQLLSLFRRIMPSNAGVIVPSGVYTNLVPTSIDTDGSVFDGVGYRDGYRFNSSGVLSAQAGTTSTGFIKVNASDVIRMAGNPWLPEYTEAPASGVHSYIVFYDSAFTYLGSYNNTRNQTQTTQAPRGIVTAGSVVTDENGVTTYNITFSDSSKIAYVRLNSWGSGADMIVTVNEEIK